MDWKDHSRKKNHPRYQPVQMIEKMSSRSTKSWNASHEYLVILCTFVTDTNSNRFKGWQCLMIFRISDFGPRHFFDFSFWQISRRWLSSFTISCQEMQKLVSAISSMQTETICSFGRKWIEDLFHRYTVSKSGVSIFFFPPIFEFGRPLTNHPQFTDHS
jgi:hypothetical protein